jgi:adenylate cyclase
LVRQQKSDEAIDALERAIALDPSEPSNYWQMSQALTFNGRAVGGMGFLDAATRVDPGWTNWRRNLEGLAYFSMGRFADAAASLEKLDLQSDDFWSKFYGLQVLLSAYGYVGGNADIAAVKDQLKPLLNEESEGQELSGLLAQNFFAFRNRPDFDRLLAGLRKAGVPEVPFGMDGAAKDRLTGEEIAAVFIGHEVEGRDPDNGECYWGTTAADGMAHIKLGTWSDTGSFRIEGNTACAYWSTGFRVCSIIFRNPTGTFGRRNEYIPTTDTRRLEFSVVK